MPPISKRPYVSVIINNYNGDDYIHICLQSVFRTNYPRLEVIVIDDCSEDSSIEKVERNFKNEARLRIHKMKRNSGTAATRNKGAKLAKGDIVVFLDNDTKVNPRWIKELVSTLSRNNKIGAAQSLLLDFEKKDLIQMAGGRLIPQVGWLAPYNQWDSYKKVNKRLKERNILGITAAFAVKRKVFKKIGYFDEKLVAYVSDVEFSWRAWIAGYEVVLSPKSIVFHWTKPMEKRDHMHETRINAYFHLSKNSIRTILKNYEFRNVLRYLPYSIAINLGRVFVVLIRRGDTSSLFGTAKGIVWNIFNIKNTLNKRRTVQNTRAVTDDYIMRRVMTNDSLWEIYKRYFRSSI